MERLRAKVSEHTLITWLEPIICEEMSRERIVLSAPTNFFVTWIKDHYLGLLQTTINEVGDITPQIYLRSRNEFQEPDKESTQEFQRNELNNGSCTSITSEFALKHNLNPRYTFESFVVGGCNQFANAAALSIADNLGGTYNPLFIYGGVGLGKTHLMSAIGYSVLGRKNGALVSFCTSEEFTNEMINAIRFDKMVDFRNKYRNLDLLLMDDIQFLARKERTQEEFFHTFNRMYERGKQIIITADCLPVDLADIELRLKSRFGWGLVADMGTPDLETRVAILKRKAYEDKLDLPDDVAYFLAEHVDSNVRDMEGYLVRVMAMSILQGIPLTMDLAEVALKDIIHRRTKPITVEMIISHVSKTFNVKTSDIKSKKRHKLYSFPRQVGMYLARELTECSYPEIGAAFGGKDHSTVIYASRKIEKGMETDHSLKNTIEGLKRKLAG